MYKIKYPVAFHTVDCCITRIYKGQIQVLLSQKVKDTEGSMLWRFPGGFIDPWDSCAEEAAIREAMEETGMTFVEGILGDKLKQYFEEKEKITLNIPHLLEEIENTKNVDGQNKLDDDLTSGLIKQAFLVQLPESLINFVRTKCTYVGSIKIDDGRYRDSVHKVITSLYELHPLANFDIDGEGPFDDIARTKWFYLSELEKTKNDIVHPIHLVLLDLLIAKYILKNKDFASSIEELIEEFEKVLLDLKIKIKNQKLEEKIKNAGEKGIEIIKTNITNLFNDIISKIK